MVTLAYSGKCLINPLINHQADGGTYIYGQNNPPYSDLQFGFFKSEYNGCGWIATYNALIMLGCQTKPADIISEYEVTGAVLYGVFGVQPYAITHYFRFRGYKVKTTYKTSKFNDVAKQHTANIIFYFFPWGAHYFATRYDGNKFLAYNFYASSKTVKTFSTLDEALSEGESKGAMMISIDKK